MQYIMYACQKREYHTKYQHTQMFTSGK